MADDALGPISYLVVEFPTNQMNGEGLERLVELVDLGVIRVLDLAFVSRGDDGSIVAIDIEDVDRDGDFDIAVFEGVSSGLLDDTDRDALSDVIEPGTSAAILLFENRWALPFMQAIRSNGAEVVAAGYVPMEDLVASLEAAETR